MLKIGNQMSNKKISALGGSAWGGKNKILLFSITIIFAWVFLVLVNNALAQEYEDWGYYSDDTSYDSETGGTYDSSEYDYYDISTESGLSAYCDTEEGQNDPDCTSVYDYAEEGGTKGSKCVEAENWYSADSCASGYTCNAETSKCEISLWGKMTGVGTGIVNQASQASQVGTYNTGSVLNVTGNGILGPVSSSNYYGNSSSNGFGGYYSSSSEAGSYGQGCGNGFTPIGGVCFPTNTGLSSASIYDILSDIFLWLMGLFTIFAVIAFVISGIQYLTSAGDSEQIETAKRNAKYALLGVVIGLSGFVILQAVAVALSGSGYFF
jgi:hypothetical protein